MKGLRSPITVALLFFVLTGYKKANYPGTIKIAPASLVLRPLISADVNPPAPSLFWAEEFNTDGTPDPKKWDYAIGAGGWGNNELEYYTSRPENAIVQGGVLKIKVIRENYKGSFYTSARLVSKGKFEFKYGKVEIKAKLPTGIGTWPAIWMLGSNERFAGWPECGEIDIMEHVGRRLIQFIVHFITPGILVPMPMVVQN